MYPDEDDPAIGRRDDRKSPNGVSVPINECRKLGSDRCVENDRNWVQFAEAVIQRATRRGAPPPSET